MGDHVSLSLPLDAASAQTADNDAERSALGLATSAGADPAGAATEYRRAAAGPGQVTTSGPAGCGAWFGVLKYWIVDPDVAILR
jgi:hypothetical protein